MVDQFAHVSLRNAMCFEVFGLASGMAGMPGQGVR